MALRSILRHDFDVPMIGEIRDAETAKIALEASLAVRLVLTTLHANSAERAVDRLTNLGVDPALLEGSLRGVLAQKLEASESADVKRSFHANFVDTIRHHKVITSCKSCRQEKI